MPEAKEKSLADSCSDRFDAEFTCLVTMPPSSFPKRPLFLVFFLPRLDFQRGLTLTYGSARLSNGCNSFKSKYISCRIHLLRQFCQNRQDRKSHCSETFWLLRQCSFDWAQLPPESQLNRGGPNGTTNFIFYGQNVIENKH